MLNAKHGPTLVEFRPDVCALREHAAHGRRATSILHHTVQAEHRLKAYVTPISVMEPLCVVGRGTQQQQRATLRGCHAEMARGPWTPALGEAGGKPGV